MSGHSILRPVRLRSIEDAHRKVTWLELFFDLAFVAAVAQVGTPLAMDYTVAGLARYALLFFLVWWAWLGQTLYATRFDTDDLVQRLLTLAQIFGVAAMAINADDALHSRSSAGFAAAYGALRFILVAQYVRARAVARARTFATRNAAGLGLAAGVWIASSLVPAPWRYVLWAVALGVDIATPIATARFTTAVPPDAAHLPERFGLFTIILLGESLVAVMKGMKSQEAWSVPAAASAFLGMLVAFAIWWWYFDGVEGAGERHVRSRRDAGLFHTWVGAHFPLYLGIGVAGVGAEHVIRFAPEGHLHATEAWLLAGALAAAMVSVSVIAASRPGALADAAVRRALGSHCALSGVTLVLGAAGASLPPALFLLALGGLLLAQVGISLARPAPPGLVTEPHSSHV